MAEFQEVDTLTLPKEKEEISTPKILEKLNLQEVESSEGLPYKIYTFKNKEKQPVEVLFYSPNELPFIQKEFKDKNVTLLGDEPAWRSKEDWSGYKNKLEENQAENQQKMIITEARPKSLLETAQKLGIDLDNDLKDALINLEYRRITPKTNEMIDKIIAGNVINNQDELRTSNEHEGEALFLLSLQGDKNANEILEKKLSFINRIDKEKHEEELKYDENYKRYEDGEQIESLDSLVAVHCDDYPAVQGENGLEKISKFDATNWSVPRETFHFYLNGLVESHSGGHWEGNHYAMIAPLKEIIKLNGKPESLNTEDTFWEINPGETLKFPKDTVIVSPSILPEGKLIEGFESNDIKYKSSDFSKEDVSQLCQMIENQYGESGLKKFNETLITETLEKKIFTAYEGIEIDDKFIYLTQKQAHFIATDLAPKMEENNNFLNLLKGQSITESVKNILGQFKIDISERNINVFYKAIETEISGKIKKIAVDKKLEMMGYKDIPKRDYEHGNTNIIKLAKELKTSWHMHFHSKNRDIEDSLSLQGLFTSFLSSERMGKFNQYKASNFKDKLKEYSSKTRRMLYLSGLI